MSHAIVTPEQMYAAEQRVFDAGTPSFDVMRVAGEAVADRLHEAFPAGRIRVLCGPGGNGGDGFIAAHRLRELGRDVDVYLLGSPDKLKGDSARACSLWNGPVHGLDDAVGMAADITLDALFGGGLSRPLKGAAASLAEEPGTVVSVDVPSGIDGLTAKPIGPCFTADLTVTFAAFRPAHVLSPGRGHCGKVHVEDIGVPVSQQVRINHPSIWLDDEKASDTGPGASAPEMRFYGEDAFDQTFPGNMQDADNRIDAVMRAAKVAGGLIVLAAKETLIAEPDGRCVVDLSLTGGSVSKTSFRTAFQEAMLTGLPPFEAACKAAQASLRS
ncbi:NAD(P)H-hydrate epimerase [Henriciella sp.]|uniref:NAD(P)H-hydrate epimerase n=1 Tax=Henriciella sp. TaxID=1968823 RepID=UPI0026027630|nr:NAD(P)H-hydrate epimerase [Henriciella sp.]